MREKVLKQNIITGIVVIVFAAAAFALSFEMPGTAPMFPRIASGVLCLLGVLLALTSAIKLKNSAEVKEEAADIRDFVKPACYFTMIIFYVVLLKVIGFYVTTAIMLLVYMWILGIRNIKPLLITTVIVTALIYAVFTVALKVPLPKGFLI